MAELVLFLILKLATVLLIPVVVAVVQVMLQVRQHVSVVTAELVL